VLYNYTAQIDSTQEIILTTFNYYQRVSGSGYALTQIPRLRLGTSDLLGMLGESANKGYD